MVGGDLNENIKKLMKVKVVLILFLKYYPIK